ncbi:MAG: serine hydrolase [Betaproteobacteria bacterium]|nr:serine hydrolase [Betaproteobacteria bacterium]
MQDPDLAQALRAAILAQDFASTPDSWQYDAPLGLHPSIDLALAVFPRTGPPRWANVLSSREHPQGVVAELGPDAGAVRNVQFLCDLQNERGESIVWLPGADWSTLDFRPLSGNGPWRFVAPYPASLLKLMVAFGVALAVDRGLCHWPAALEPMIVISDNRSTDECVALMHRCGVVGLLNQSLAERGLTTLQLNDTTPAGGWRNADGAGVGHIHMTAWDSLRLLWLIDAAAPPPPWLPPGLPPLLQPASAARLHDVLRRQQLEETLSSGSLKHLPGWVPGLPDAPVFAHKTGNTDNYASDAGIVQQGGTHYIVSVFTSLGRRYAPVAAAATTWRLPALGAAVHRIAEALA